MEYFSITLYSHLECRNKTLLHNTNLKIKSVIIRSLFFFPHAITCLIGFQVLIFSACIFANISKSNKQYAVATEF